MSTDVTHTIECAQCGTPLDSAIPPGTPCSQCGCTARHHRVGVVDLISPKAEVSFGLRGKSAERYKGTSRSKRHVREQYLDVGPSADGVRRRAHRVFDRGQDRYEEVVTEEETGWLVRYLREPVSAHRERGAAKKKTYLDGCSWAIDSVHPEDRERLPKPESYWQRKGIG